MDAVTLITEKMDVYKLLEHYDFDKIKQDGDIIRACCKIHGGNNPTSFVINTNTGYWYCHTHCGGGDIFTLVERFEGFTQKDFVQKTVPWLSSFFDVDISDLPITKRKDKIGNELKKYIEVMKSKRKKELIEFTIPEEIKKVSKYRKFKLETLEHFNLGYVDKVSLLKRNGEEYTLYNRLAFPIYFNNIQIGISFRKVKEVDFPKWSHQPAHIEINNILYNYDDCKSSKEIVVCEGISDVWAFYEIGIPAVATFGAHITKEQYKLLLKTGADLIFAFDGDEAGQKATKTVIEMFKYKANLSTIEFAITQDPENITREELYERYSNHKRL